MGTHLKFINIKTIFLAVCIGSLINCGGGGGSNTTPTGKIEVPADFDILSQSGVWRTSFDFNLPSLNYKILGGPEDIQVNGSLHVNSIVTTSFQNSGSTTTADNCDAATAETITYDDLIDSDIFTSLNGDTDLGCTTQASFTKTDDSNYRIKLTCGSTTTGEMVFTKLSNSTEFNFGSLSFTSTKHANLETSSGVCGNLDNFSGTFNYSPQPNSFGITNEVRQESTFRISAPYDGNKIALEFTFPNDITPGTYNVVEDFTTNSNEVLIDLESVIYGGTPALPLYSTATSGTVTVTSISQYAASGSFSISTDPYGVDGGDTMVGTFSFDIE